MATLDLSKRPSQRFFEVGNGKATPEIASTGDFYTAWARSGRSSRRPKCKLFAHTTLSKTMNEGWQNDDHLILFTEDESAKAMIAYDFDRFIPGYALVGLKGWDEFIVIGPSGGLHVVPTVPLDASRAVSYVLPQPISLQADSHFTKKIKWYLKPLVLGGSSTDDTNIAWISHAQHAEVVRWWNEQYRQAQGH